MSQYIIINLTYLFLLCYYIYHSKSRLKCIHESIATVVKVLQQLQKRNYNLISLQTYTRTGFRTLQTTTEFEISKKIKKNYSFLVFLKKTFLGLTLEQFKT